ncbi:porin, partial [Corallococcus exercitus]
MRSLLVTFSLLTSSAAMAQASTPQEALPTPPASEPREAVEPSATDAQA